MLLLFACARVHDPGAPPPAAAGEPSVLDGPAALTSGTPGAALATAPASVQVLDEAALAALLRNEADTALVVNFWATWCGPCVDEMEVFREVSADTTGARFALVSVDSRRDRPVLAPFLAARQVKLPAYHLDSDDPSGVLARTVEGWPDVIPVTLVLEPGGAVRTRFDGVVDAQRLRAALVPTE